MRVVTNWAVGHITYTQQLQLTMGVVVVCGLVIMGLHGFISAKFPTNRDEMNDAVIAKAKRLARKRELLNRGAAGMDLSSHLCAHLCDRIWNERV